jgi:hypothetical protein
MDKLGKYKTKLIGIWYALILIILASLLYEQTAKFDFTSILFWVRWALLIVALLLSFYVLEDILMPHKVARRVEKVFSKELQRKDHRIRQLKEEKDLFMNSALKRSEENQKLKEALRRNSK